MGRINEGIDDLWERYNEFKSIRSVLDPNYQTLHNIALDSDLKGKDIVSAVQALQKQPQSKTSSSTAKLFNDASFISLQDISKPSKKTKPILFKFIYYPSMSS